MAAVQIYLRQERGVNPDAMQIELAELTLDADQARALIRFESPDLPQGLRFVYLLERREGTWTVTSSSGEGSHGGGSRGLPEGHPPLPDPPDQETAPSPHSG